MGLLLLTSHAESTTCMTKPQIKDVVPVLVKNFVPVAVIAFQYWYRTRFIFFMFVQTHDRCMTIQMHDMQIEALMAQKLNEKKRSVLTHDAVDPANSLKVWEVHPTWQIDLKAKALHVYTANVGLTRNKQQQALFAGLVCNDAADTPGPKLSSRC